MGARMKLCLFICAAPVLLLAVIIGSFSPDQNQCYSNADCECPPEWGLQRSWCHSGVCFGGRPGDSRCAGQPDTHVAGENAWCWKEELVMICNKRQFSLGEKAAVATIIFLHRLGGRFLGEALPKMALMWLQPSDVDAQVVGCQIFSEFGWHVPDRKEAFMKFGAIDLAIKALKRFEGNRRLEDACYNGMAALSLYNRPVSLRVGELGGVEMTAAYWRRNFDDPDVMPANYFGCYQDFSPENRERMRKAGAIKLALDACGENGRHFWNAAAQFSCWCEFSSFHSEENHREFRRLGGIRHTYVVFRDHGKSYRVREEILQAARGICAFRANREDLVREGFVEVLTDALKTEKLDPQIQSLGTETLRLFVDGNATLRAGVVANGGLELGLDALGAHSAKLIDTRADWDAQNVYGEFNDEQYNVAGGASELLYSLALDGRKTLKAMVELGAIQRLDAAITATQRRVPSVRWRTFRASCQVLRMLKEAAQEAGQEKERQRAMASHDCPNYDLYPELSLADVKFEP